MEIVNFIQLLLIPLGQYRISEMIHKMEPGQSYLPTKIMGASQLPNGVVFFDKRDQVFVLSGSGNFHVAWGGRGQGPKEFNMLINSLVVDGDQIKILSEFGARQDIFSLNGTSIQRQRFSLKALTFWRDENLSVRLKTDLKEAAKNIELNFNLNGKDNFITLLQGEDEDVAFAGRLIFHKFQNYLMASTTYGLRGRLYFVVYDLKRQEFLEVGHKNVLGPKRTGAVQAAKKNSAARGKNFSIRILDGMTSDPRWGFILSERSQPQKQILQTYDPIERAWGSLFIDMGPLRNLSFFVPFQKDIWGAFDGDSFVIFRVEKS